MAEGYVFKKGVIINCTLKNAEEVNPQQVNYTWFWCASDCDGDRPHWKLKSKSYFLQVDRKPAGVFGTPYRCKAENAAGSDSKTTDVYNYGKF